MIHELPEVSESEQEFIVKNYLDVLVEKYNISHNQLKLKALYRGLQSMEKTLFLSRVSGLWSEYCHEGPLKWSKKVREAYYQEITQ